MACTGTRRGTNLVLPHRRCLRFDRYDWRPGNRPCLQKEAPWSADALERMYSLKTGALIHASVYVRQPRCVKTSLTMTPVPGDRRIRSGTIGIAFQIKDDILDVEGETHVIGKQAGADQRLEKSDVSRAFSVSIQSRQRCNELSAVTHCEQLEPSSVTMRRLLNGSRVSSLIAAE